MDYTSRMVALLRELRRERNGAVADSMRYYGTPYGLNYGVSLPTLRRIARAEAPDHGFARYLYRQDVRELRLAALHIAWSGVPYAGGVPRMGRRHRQFRNRRGSRFCPAEPSEAFPALFSAWIASPDALLQYAALLAAARSPRLTASWVAPAVEAVHRNATAEATVETPAEAMTEATAAAISAAADTSVAPGAFVADTSVTEASSPEVATPAPGDSSVGDTLSAAIVSAAPGASPAADPHVASPCAAGQQVSSRPLAQPPVPAARLTAQGAVALLAAVAAQNEENRQAVLRAAGSLGKLPAEDYVHEELAWRLEA